MNDFKLAGRVVEATSRSIRSGDKVTRLRPLCWDVLMHLVEHRDEIVSSEALLEAVWAGRTTNATHVRKAVHEIRAALDDRDGRILKNLPRVGYVVEASAIEDATTREGVASGAEAPAPGETLVYGRLASRDYKSISDRLRKKEGSGPSRS